MRGRAAACLLVLAALLGALGAAPARAEGVELSHLSLQRLDAGLSLDFNIRVALPPVVEDALQRGVPMYFVAEARVLRSRWYWRG